MRLCKLYKVTLTADTHGPEMYREGMTVQSAGEYIFNLEKKDHGFENNLWFIQVGGRLYRYISVPDGFGWERCDGEDGPAFAPN